MKIWVVVELFQLIVEAVILCSDENEAEKHFKGLTEMTEKELYVDGECMKEDYDGTKIFEKEFGTGVYFVPKNHFSVTKIKPDDVKVLVLP